MRVATLNLRTKDGRAKRMAKAGGRREAGRLAFAIVVGLVIGASVEAAEVEEMAPLRAAFPERAQGCFARTYERAHLAKNPDQSVASIRLGRLKRERAREDVEGPEAPTVALSLLARLRSGAAGAEPLDCEAIYVDADRRTPSSPPAYLRCRSACNRGFVDVTPDGADRVRLTIGGEAMGRFTPDAVGVGHTCASDAGVTWLGDRTGDRVFLLDRADLGACR